MIVLVTDPITNKLVTNPKKHPFVIQGSGRSTTKIYFESQASKEEFMKSNKLKAMFS